MAVPSAPLWNHQTTGIASYTLYSSPTFNGAVTITNPGASSKLCLSCHDGTVALENFGGTTTGTSYISAANKVGGATGNNLSTEHPISFDYTDALAVLDKGLNTPSTTNSGLGGTISTDLLFAGKMECASCHDVHNNYNVSHLLKVSNTNSQLCLLCHKK
jgi:predicted CXXCH cytochrome family protein